MRDISRKAQSKIGVYIKTLIDISRTAAGYQLHCEAFDLSDYMEQIAVLANSLCLTKGICLHMETATDLGTLVADKLLLDRAILNVIGNALDYSPPAGTIHVVARKNQTVLCKSLSPTRRAASHRKPCLMRRNNFLWEKKAGPPVCTLAWGFLSQTASSGSITGSLC